MISQFSQFIHFTFNTRINKVVLSLNLAMRVFMMSLSSSCPFCPSAKQWEFERFIRKNGCSDAPFNGIFQTVWDTGIPYSGDENSVSLFNFWPKSTIPEEDYQKVRSASKCGKDFRSVNTVNLKACSLQICNEIHQFFIEEFLLALPDNYKYIFLPGHSLLLYCCGVFFLVRDVDDSAYYLKQPKIKRFWVFVYSLCFLLCSDKSIRREFYLNKPVEKDK